VLYEESQGIIDIVVKLFMLGQARAMELGATRKSKRSEIMDAALFQAVAADHFKIIAPMIAALKSGKPSKIAQYADLRPLEDHVGQALQAAQIHLEPYGTSAQAKTTPATHADVTTETLVTKLNELGLAEDIAQRMAVEAQAEHPEASLLQLVGLISAQLYESAHEPNPASPPRKENAQRKKKTLSRFEEIVAAGTQKEQSSHASLSKAGLVATPLLGRDE
jgi:hypothetical protein